MKLSFTMSLVNSKKSSIPIKQQIIVLYHQIKVLIRSIRLNCYPNSILRDKIISIWNIKHCEIPKKFENVLKKKFTDQVKSNQYKIGFIKKNRFVLF